MKATTLRVIIISHPDLVTVHAALEKLLTKGGELDAVESGVVAEGQVVNVELVGPPPPLIFDGVNFTQVLYVATG